MGSEDVGCVALKTTPMRIEVRKITSLKPVKIVAIIKVEN